MHHACGVGLNPCVRERGRNLKQAKDVNRLAVCSGNEIPANQNGEQQDIERNVRGNPLTRVNLLWVLGAAGGGEM